MALSVAMYAAGKAGKKQREARIAELERMLSDYQAVTTRVTFDHEMYFNGIRFDAGEYVIRRLGPPCPDEVGHPF